MLQFLRNNKSFARIALIVLIASLCLGFIIPVVFWMLPENQEEASYEAYINAEILALEEELLIYEETLKENPNDGDAWAQKANVEYSLGSLMYDTGKSEEGVKYFSDATESYQEALKYNGDDVYIRNDLASVAYYSGKYDLAETNFKKAIELDPKYVNARVNYGLFLYDIKKDYEGAIKEWEAALASKPENEEDVKTIESLIAIAKENM